MVALAASFLPPVDPVELEREIAKCREDLRRFLAGSKKPGHGGWKIRVQIGACRRHLIRLEGLRDAA